MFSVGQQSRHGLGMTRASPEPIIKLLSKSMVSEDLTGKDQLQVHSCVFLINTGARRQLNYG